MVVGFVVALYSHQAVVVYLAEQMNLDTAESERQSLRLLLSLLQQNMEVLPFSVPHSSVGVVAVVDIKVLEAMDADASRLALLPLLSAPHSCPSPRRLPLLLQQNVEVLPFSVPHSIVGVVAVVDVKVLVAMDADASRLALLPFLSAPQEFLLAMTAAVLQQTLEVRVLQHFCAQS